MLCERVVGVRRALRQIDTERYRDVLREREREIEIETERERARTRVSENLRE